MPNINDSFSSKYLKASDIGTEGDSAVVTINRVVTEMIKNRETNQNESKPVVTFRELEKPLILNKTNAKKIESLLKSDDTDDWEGKQVQLYATETQFGADTVACIRVKQAALPTKKEKAKFTPPPSPAAETIDDDVPF